MKRAYGPSATSPDRNLVADSLQESVDDAG
jgi:hypothetical protein